MVSVLTLFAVAAGLAGLPHTVKLKAEPFSLQEVQLLDGPFKQAEKRCAAYLLTVDPDRLLHSFMVNSGLKAKAPMYGGWESEGLAGHSLGHYLTACSQEYAASRDARFKAKVDYIISELTACQKNRPDGYIAAMPNGDRVWAEVKKGDIRSHGFDLNGLWSPWYTHHKVLAGLIDAYELTGSKPALEVARKFADWAWNETAGLNDEQWQRMLVCEYGGMNDALAELYADTGDSKYLTLSRKFYDHRILDPLAEGQDDLSGKHANMNIPKIIGLARLHELTGSEQDAKTATFFWQTVADHHSYVIGGNSNNEYWGPADKLANALSTNTCETCCTYNMLKLTRHLFEWDPEVRYADFYEQAHLNDILASESPDEGMFTYFVPLSSGGHRTYSDPYDTWTCCHGTGMENHTKHGDSIYFHSGNDRLYVNQFIPNELSWPQAGYKIRLESKYPADGKVSITIEKAGRRPLELMLRHPGWAKGDMPISVGGQALPMDSAPGTYAAVKRRWRDGDRIEFTVPMALRDQAMPDDPKRIALLYGPVVLAADLGPNRGPRPRTPVLVTEDKAPSEWLKPVEGGALEFKTDGVGRPTTDLTLKPFYAISHNRYAVYFDEFTQAQWDQTEADYRAEEARVKDLEARTVDFSRIGEMQPERDHEVKSEKCDVREANGRGFRTPLPGGWFECTLKVDPAAACELVVTYWGNDRYSPNFDILVDGQKLTTETLEKRKANAFSDVSYQLPTALTEAKQKVVIRFQASADHPGGSVAGIRLVRAAG